MIDVNQLAIFGGRPRFAEPLHVGRPNIGDRARLSERIEDMLDRRWLTNDGPYVKELERRIAEYTGVRNCVAVCNATVALEIVVRAADLHGEVIVPSFTFIATAHALEWLGVTPVFCDVDPQTHNIDPHEVERLITPRTAAILGVHLWGRPCDVQALEEIARRHDLKLFFDAAHGFGCSHRGRMIGGFGDAEVFSFHGTKFFNSGEGGAVLTNDDDFADAVRRMRNFGYDADDVVSVGTNGKMNELSAAMGLTSLESIDTFVDANRRNWHQYSERLAGVAGVSVIRYDERERNNFQYIVLEIDEGSAGVSRDVLVDILRAEGVLSRRYFHPGCHRSGPYDARGLQHGQSLEATERLSDRLMALPNGTAVDAAAIDMICDLIGGVVAQADEVALMLEPQTTA